MQRQEDLKPKVSLSILAKTCLRIKKGVGGGSIAQWESVPTQWEVPEQVHLVGQARVVSRGQGTRPEEPLEAGAGQAKREGCSLSTYV